jgi:hypothetical protein
VIVFEWIIGILLGAVLLSQLAKRIGAPYPALLALGRDLNAEAQFGVLTSDSAPDRLRRLPVDANERPSHVLRVTKADRLRYTFDRFGGRL